MPYHRRVTSSPSNNPTTLLNVKYRAQWFTQSALQRYTPSTPLTRRGRDKTLTRSCQHRLGRYGRPSVSRPQCTVCRFLANTESLCRYHVRCFLKLNAIYIRLGDYVKHSLFVIAGLLSQPDAIIQCMSPFALSMFFFSLSLLSYHKKITHC